MCVHKSLQSCLTLWYPMDCSPSGFSVHGIFQARIRDWVVIPFSRGSSLPRDQTQSPAGGFFTNWATREALFILEVLESERKWSRSVVSDPQWPHGLQPARLLCPWDFPGKSTGVGCHCLLHSNEYSGLIFFKIDWFDLLAVQVTPKSLLQHHSSKASIL